MGGHLPKGDTIGDTIADLNIENLFYFIAAKFN